VQEKEEWRIRYIQELYQLYGHRISSERLKKQGCEGQRTYKKMGNNEVPRRITDSKLEASRRQGGLKTGVWVAWWKI
jgi:hypothetical protein